MSEFFQNLRLDYIDWKIGTSGTIGRPDIAKTFDVSSQQASLDIREFLGLYPSAMHYDVKRKVYVRKRVDYRRRRDRPGLAAALEWE